MINEDTVADYITGLAILSKSLPAGLVDANGDNLSDCMAQNLHDLAAELGVTSLVRWDAQGEPANVAIVDSLALAHLVRGAGLVTDGYAMLGDEKSFITVMKRGTRHD